jgi:ABC-type transport system substrate-binding protein
MDIQELPQAVLTEMRSKPETTPDLVFTSGSPDALSSYTMAYIYYDAKGPLAHAWFDYPEVDALIESAYSELDRNKRVGMYQQVGQILGQKLPVFTVFELDYAITHSPKLTNLKVHSGFFYCFDWYGAQLAS